MTTPAEGEHAGPTKPLYQHEEQLRKHVTRMTALRSYGDLTDGEKALFKSGNDKTYAIECHETIFYAQGGGQPYDTGYMTTAANGHVSGEGWRFVVEAVRNAGEGRVLHFGRFEIDSNTQPEPPKALEAGDMLEQHVDGKRRDQNSRVHTAGHIVALAVRRLAETNPELRVLDTKAQHYPDASYVEFLGLIDGKYKDDIQGVSNTMVKDALPVKLYWCKPEELGQTNAITNDEMPIVTGLDGMVRVVDIVGAGAYPCGGTHTQDTSLVGEITVSKIKRQKGSTKVSYTVADS